MCVCVALCMRRKEVRRKDEVNEPSRKPKWREGYSVSSLHQMNVMNENEISYFNSGS